LLLLLLIRKLFNEIVETRLVVERIVISTNERENAKCVFERITDSTRKALSSIDVVGGVINRSDDDAAEDGGGGGGGGGCDKEMGDNIVELFASELGVERTFEEKLNQVQV
jgi:hypothetical protein